VSGEGVAFAKDILYTREQMNCNLLVLVSLHGQRGEPRENTLSCQNMVRTLLKVTVSVMTSK